MERGPKNSYEAGQPINTDDSMNDMPTFAERAKNNVPEVLEYLNEHPELKKGLAQTTAKLEELNSLLENGGIEDAEANNNVFLKSVEAFNTTVKANQKTQELLKNKLEDHEVRKLDGELSEEEYNEAVANIKNNLDETQANNAAAEAIAQAVQKRKAAEGKLANAESELDNLDTQHLDGNISEDEFASESKRLNQIIEDAKKEIEEANKAISENNFEAGDGAKPAEAAGAEDGGNGNAGEANPEPEPEKSDEEKLKEWRESQDQIKAGIDEEYQKLIADAEAAGDAEEVERLKAEYAHKLGEDRSKEGSLETAADEEEKDKEELAKFIEDHMNDPEWRAIYTRNGVFDEQRCRDALIGMYQARKEDEAKFQAQRAKDVQNIMAEEAGEGDDENGENGEDDGNKQERVKLFDRIRNFFGRNNRVKKGGKNALKNNGKLHGWKKVAMVALLALVAGTQLANFMPKANGSNANNMNIPIPEAVVTAQAAESTQEDAGDEISLEDLSENLSLNVDLNAEKDVEDTKIDARVYGKEVSFDKMQDLWDGESTFYDEVGETGTEYGKKSNQFALASWMYDRNDESLTDEEIAEIGFNNLLGRATDPSLSGQYAAFLGSEFVFEDDTNGISNLREMNHVQDVTSTSEEAREMVGNSFKDWLESFAEDPTTDIRVMEEAKGDVHFSLYMAEVDGDAQYIFQDATRPAPESFKVLQFINNETGENKLDSNEIGGPKYNFLKAVGVIPENASDEEAQKIMDKYHIDGISLKCGQVIGHVGNPDTGSENETGTEGDRDTGTEGDQDTGTEGDQDTGTEGDQDTGTEGDQDTGTEGDQDTGTEGDQDTGTEGDRDTGTEGDQDTGTEGDRDTGTEGDRDTGTEGDIDTGTEGDVDTGTEGDIDTGTEGDIDTGTEGDIDTGTEGDIDTGTEGDADDGKTDVHPDTDDSGWDNIDQPTQEETGPIDQADNTPVDEGGNGYVNDEAAGTSSNLAEDEFLNGGDQGGGNTDADGGGSDNPETEATYDGSDTSGYDNGAAQEEGTQTVDEPSTQEEVNQVNDSEANQDSAGEDRPAGEGASEAMDRIG